MPYRMWLGYAWQGRLTFELGLCEILEVATLLPAGACMAMSTSRQVLLMLMLPPTWLSLQNTIRWRDINCLTGYVCVVLKALVPWLLHIRILLARALHHCYAHDNSSAGGHQ